MWLYVPKTSSHSSAALVGSTSASQQLSEASAERLERFAWWRGKCSAPHVWRRRWKRAPWMRVLSGLTSEPSTLDRGVVSFLASLVASRVKTSASQGGAPGSEASAPGFSGSSLESFASWSPDGSFWKTSQRSLFEDSTPYSESWPKQGTMRSGAVFERQTSARLTGETDGSAWPTAAAFDATYSVEPATWDKRVKRLKAQYNNGNRAGPRLSVEACRDRFRQAWPTPTARDHKGSLDPNTRDRLSGTLDEKAERLTPGLQALTTSTPGAASSTSGPTSRPRLNPAFVEWMMGLPSGWTGLER